MRITAQPGTPIRLPLETAFSIDIAALLPEGATLGALYLESNSEGYYPELRQVGPIEGTVASYTVGEKWEGFPIDFLNPLNAVGRMLIYTNAEELIVVDILPSLPMTGEAPSIKGTAGRDTMVYDAEDAAGLGVSLVDTSGGSDNASIVNGAGILLGRAGNDTLTGWDLDDALYGGGGRDALFGGAGNDRLFGLNGNDRAFGGAGYDLLAGGNGNDSLTGGIGNDTLSAGNGMDTLRGEIGDDRFVLTQRTGDYALRPANTVLAYGGEGNDTFSTLDEDRGHAGEGPIVRGDAGMVELYGGAGNDNMEIGTIAGGALYGGDGNDTIRSDIDGGLTGTATVYGGNGDDNLYGGRGVDVYGGTGLDYIIVAEGSKATAGDGNDTVYIDYNYVEDSLTATGGEAYGGQGNDILYGLSRADTLHGGVGDDTLDGNAGNDQLFGGASNDALWAGAGSDTLWGEDGDDVLLSYDNGTYTDDEIGTGLSRLADRVYGGTGNDRIQTDRAGHMLYGGDGDDLVTVGEANLGVLNTYAEDPSILDGGLGNDTLQASGFSGAAGGEGTDTFVLDMLNLDANNTMVVSDFVRGEDKVDFLGLVFFGEQATAANIRTFINNGPLDPNNATGLLTVAWQSGGSNRVDVQVDLNGDGTYEGRFILTGIGDFLLSDFAPLAT